MKDNEFLFDASALYSLLDYSDKLDFKRSHILTLTLYEVGNAIWKEYYLHKKVKDPITLSTLFYKFMTKFNVIGNLLFEGVMKIAVEEGLSYYDASYVYAAKSLGLVLVSNDKDLIRKANAISLKDFIKLI
ncbi:type II toxin-antitoxin system VapC family toxin [Acidianus brierleyi]|uniref:PIN domain nuclease n=1 Tax=Acidianus brierleyi TaxID=41673 RepID=A0A2U9IHQ1_9CREN|nr:type II toxin-antitoxin system VapC family toxin [Acidianus brierleyi]AWR95583.1 PIN domain-containing protein [Acidianus brierleyi]